MARCVQATLFISHDLRRDSELVLVLSGPPDPPKAIRVIGADVRRLNPDERSTVALLSRALEVGLPANGREVESTPGIHVSRRDLAAVLEVHDEGMVVLLDEQGEVGIDTLAGELQEDEVTFVLGDDTGLSEEETVMLRSRDALGLSLGPLSLHADHCITIVHNALDRAAVHGTVPSP
jgi:tRNA (pseudouridine54-N1)-methyltransferase